ncbi:MAG: efflux RND transporter periplasmic adaptor subunit [Deltaproteobacteria bacterium]|nr:efflux RND transporter periplasmic adaptor subunit [Deltaproteobacteria bacterium]
MKTNLSLWAFCSSKFGKKLPIFIGVAILCATLTVVITSSKPADNSPQQSITNIARGLPTTIRTITPQSYPSKISVLGEVTPLWQATIKTQVDGQIVYVSDQLQAGCRVKKGEVLIRIAKSAYEMAVAEATSRLANAQVNLLREQQEVAEAQNSWRQSGLQGEPHSALVLHQPQLCAAQEEVNAAKAALTYAKERLGYTNICAPFDSVIVQRQSNPGDNLIAGDEVATLYGTNIAEIKLHLDSNQWSLLPPSLNNSEATVINKQQRARWSAKIVRESLRLNRESRLRTLFLQIDNPLEQTPPLLPATFVRVELSGKVINNLLCLPEAALTKQGIVWFVEANNRLLAHQAQVVFYGQGVVYIQAPSPATAHTRVAISPNSSFINGLLIEPHTEHEEV